MGWQIIPGRTDRQQPGNSLLKKSTSSLAMTSTFDHFSVET